MKNTDSSLNEISSGPRQILPYAKQILIVIRVWENGGKTSNA